jgi:hypothetical protein
MKNYSSYTSEVVHQRCPRRFYYRYLCESDEDVTEQEKAKARYFKRIYGLNEAIGHVVHEEIKRRIKQILDGAASIPDSMIPNAQASQHLIALAEEGAIAEVMNGIMGESEIKEMAADVDVWVVNAMETLASIYDPLSDVAELETLHHIQTSKGKRRLKMDLLLKKGRKWVIVDWKTKDEVTRNDTHQIRLYMEYIRSTRSVGFNDLIGLIVCVKSGRMQRVQLGPLDDEAYMTTKDAQWGQPTGLPSTTRQHSREPEPLLDRYPVHSGPWCRGCAFLPLCAGGQDLPS